MFRTKEDFIIAYGWSKSSRLLYLIELMKQGKTKDEISGFRTSLPEG